MAYTPRVALAEVERGTPLGARLQALIESGRTGTTFEDEKALAKVRLKQILAKYPPEKPIVATLGTAELPGKVYTTQELMEEIEKETSRGMQWIQAQINHMHYLLALR
jgi:hypothetical protein